jgi:hypothetical protein
MFVTAVAAVQVVSASGTVVVESPQPPRLRQRRNSQDEIWYAHPKFRHTQGTTETFTQLILTRVNPNHEDGGDGEATSLLQQSKGSLSMDCTKIRRTST